MEMKYFLIIGIWILTSCAPTPFHKSKFKQSKVRHDGKNYQRPAKHKVKK